MGETIADIILAPEPAAPPAPALTYSLGIVTSDDRVFWGDVVGLPQMQEVSGMLLRLTDLLAVMLKGQPLAGFRRLCDLVYDPFPPAGQVPAADAARLALQQAILAAVATTQGRGVAEVLAAEYGMGSAGQSAATVGLFLEISDFAATAERIESMLSLRPGGIGYRLTGGRVAESIGEGGQHLQRFVRELSRRMDSVYGEGGSRPAIYLGLNGALGQLAGDPVKDIGKVLGNCIGLQMAAGAHQLILEEPILLDDALVQSVNMKRLKDFVRGNTDSQRRKEPTLIVGREAGLGDEALSFYGRNQAVHALAYDLFAAGDMVSLLAYITLAREVGVLAYLRIGLPAGGRVTPRWIETMVDIATAMDVSGLLFSFDASNEGAYLVAARHLAERAAVTSI